VKQAIHFYIDPETDLPHILNHGVAECEAEEAIRNKVEVKRSRKDSYVAIGRTENGRIIKVVFIEKPEHILVVTGYELSGNELKAFRRRCRR